MPHDRQRDYRPRDWTPAELERITAQVTPDNYHVDVRILSMADRQQTLRDVSQCSHHSGTMFEVENDHGVWGVVICNDCGQFQSGPECPHVKCTWHEDGQVLICDNCGIDGT